MINAVKIDNWLKKKTKKGCSKKVSANGPKENRDTGVVKPNRTKTSNNNAFSSNRIATTYNCNTASFDNSICVSLFNKNDIPKK